MLADFKTDVAAFQAADDLPDPYGDVRGDTSYMGTQLHYFLAGARGFFQFSFGELDELAPSDLISSEFIADMSDVSGQTGQTAMNAVLYNYTTSMIDVTVPTDSESTYHFQASTNTLQVPRSAAMTVERHT